MSCQYCGKETTNPKFCSRSCAAITTNKAKKKRGLTKKCKTCDNLVKSIHVHCIVCRHIVKDMTLQETEALYSRHHRSSAYALVRSRARSIGRKLGWNTCISCGYNKHVEIAHKQPISSYSKDTLISVINNPNNLIPLCPNCHWESEHLSAPLVGLEPTSIQLR